MEIKEGCLYLIKDEYFEKYDKTKQILDNKKESRPHYYCLKEKDILWLIPISSQIDKYKKIEQKDIEKRGECNKVCFIKVGFKQREEAILIQNIIPVLPKYILKNFIIDKQNYQVGAESSKEINRKAKQIINILNKGKTFLESQKQILEIKEELLKELKIDKEKYTQIDKVEVKSKKIEFENEETGKKIYVEMIENDGKKEVRASQSSEPFNQEPDNYIKYGSIIDAAAELIKNGFVAKKEKNIEEKKLDQNFNEMLKKKAQELENKKNDELEIEK